MKDITVTELKQKIDSKEDFLLIDVREPSEYHEYNIGARLIPLGTLPAALKELKEYKDSEVVIHCRSGARSDQAKHFMLANGFNKVRNLLGGILDWKERIDV